MRSPWASVFSNDSGRSDFGSLVRAEADTASTANCQHEASDDELRSTQRSGFIKLISNSANSTRSVAPLVYFHVKAAIFF
jgi:hypothetical protein